MQISFHLLEYDDSAVILNCLGRAESGHVPKIMAPDKVAIPR